MGLFTEQLPRTGSLQSIRDLLHEAKSSRDVS